jgi:hypothetical protein
VSYIPFGRELTNDTATTRDKSAIAALTALMNESTRRRREPEIMFEIFMALGEAIQRESPQSGDAAASVFDCARSMTPMFGWHHAERAWRRHRKHMNLFRRMLTSPEMPDSFRDADVEALRADGRALVSAALADGE